MSLEIEVSSGGRGLTKVVSSIKRFHNKNNLTPVDWIYIMGAGVAG